MAEPGARSETGRKSDTAVRSQQEADNRWGTGLMRWFCSAPCNPDIELTAETEVEARNRYVELCCLLGNALVIATPRFQFVVQQLPANADK